MDVSDTPMPEVRQDDIEQAENCEACGSPLGGFRSVDTENRIVCYSCAEGDDTQAPTSEETKYKTCPVCRDFRIEVPVDGDMSDETMVEVIEHYQERHPESERLRDILSDVEARVECSDCGNKFRSGVSVDDLGGLGFRKYCEECAEDDETKASVVRRVDAEQVVEVQNAGR